MLRERLVRRPVWPRAVLLCCAAGAAVALGAGSGCTGAEELAPEGSAEGGSEVSEVAPVQSAVSSPVTVSFQDGAGGYTGTRDTSLSENAPTTVYGSNANLFADGDDPSGSGKDISALIKWDISSIPSDSTIDSATLTLRVTNASANTYSVYALKRSWTEGSATWQRATSSTSWEVAGAKGTTDRDGTVLGSFTPSSAGTYSITLNSAGISRVQQWLNSPSSNHGIIIASSSNSDGVDLASRESTTASYRPRLSVTYRAPDTGASPVLLAAGDIGNCNTSQDTATGLLLDQLPGTIAVLGDIAYNSGTTTEFANCFDPVWGRHKARMKPSPGNHEYNTAGATGYYAYFGSAAGDPSKGYYSYNLGDWHIIVLNSNCSAIGGCGAGSPQEQWLRQDLTANPRACTLAYWHHPRFSSGSHGNNSATAALWKALDDHGAELVLNGHDHNYERWKPQDSSGNYKANGIVEFVVGTGGTSLRSFTTSQPANSAARDSSTWGVLKLTLHPTSYDWEFVPISGQTYTDKGTASCH